VALLPRSEYDFYSYAPEMHYNDTDVGGCGGTCEGNVSGTKIADDDAFAMRTSLRVTIGLGTDRLYTPAPPPP